MEKIPSFSELLKQGFQLLRQRERALGGVILISMLVLNFGSIVKQAFADRMINEYEKIATVDRGEPFNIFVLAQRMQRTNLTSELAVKTREIFADFSDDWKLTKDTDGSRQKAWPYIIKVFVGKTIYDVFALFILALTSLALYVVFQHPILAPSRFWKEFSENMFPMLRLYLYVFVRSFVWIPLAGIVFGILYIPRFVASPLVLIRERKGAMYSVKQSWEKTRPLSGKVIRYSIGLLLLYFVGKIIVNLILTPFLGPHSIFLFIVQGVIFSWLVATAFCLGNAILADRN